MNTAFLKKTFAAGLGLLVVSATAPIALADVPGYLFQRVDERSPANASDSAAGTAADAQIAAANQKADQALATAQQALREAQQPTRNAAGHIPASLPPAQRGGKKN